MCERITEALVGGAAHISSASLTPSVDVAGLASVRLGSVSVDAGERALTLRAAINERLKKAKRGKGILFSIDEAQAASVEDMVALATTLQHVIRDQDMTDLDDANKKGVAFVFAALPSLMDELLNDKVLTFLRRARHHELDKVSTVDVKNAFVETVGDSGKAIRDDVALEASRMTRGYPYMVQLVGYYMWQAAERRGSRQVERQDVEVGGSDANLAFADAVCTPAYDGLTEAQRAFVDAMARGVSDAVRLKDIAEQVEKSASWASKYRSSLISAQVIVPAGRGLVRFAIPGFGEYVRSKRG